MSNNSVFTRMMGAVLKVFRYIGFKIHEKIYRGRLKYLFENNKSDSLIIVFSGFPEGKPSYNYVRTLRNNRTIDKLFILDDFGYKGSYYWLENGSVEPLKLVSELINIYLDRGGYKHVYTMGTSKGGTAAIYFGLIINAENIYAGACQYYIGNYLNTKSHRPILEGMLGKSYNQDDVDFLNQIMPNQLKKFQKTNSLVHLFYSKEEHTYKEHIVYLIEDLKVNGINVIETVEPFTNHGDVGKYFIPYIQKELNIKK